MEEDEQARVYWSVMSDMTYLYGKKAIPQDFNEFTKWLDEVMHESEPVKKSVSA